MQLNSGTMRYNAFWKKEFVSVQSIVTSWRISNALAIIIEKFKLWKHIFQKTQARSICLRNNIYNFSDASQHWQYLVSAEQFYVVRLIHMDQS